MLRSSVRDIIRRTAPQRVTQTRCFSHSHDHGHDDDKKTVTIHWLFKKTGAIVTVQAADGDNVMRLAQRNDIPLEGACEGVTACSTCHCVLEEDFYETLPEASEAEEDMLDQAFGLTATSRLGCQLKVDASYDGITITLPEATRNFYVDGHVPKPH